MGGWSGASSFICDTGILGRSFSSTGGSAWFLIQAPTLTSDLTYSMTEAKGGAGRDGLSVLITEPIIVVLIILILQFI